MASTERRNTPTDPATPVSERCVTSYPVRRGFRPGVVYPPAVPGVEGMIDVHCHSHEGQQDALSLAKVASANHMGGLLFKTIGPISGAEYRPAREVDKVRTALEEWAGHEGVEPTGCWAGYGITMDGRPPSVARLRQNIDDGVRAVWLPVFNHANTLYKVGGKRIWWDKNADPSEHSAPLPWDEAVRCGYYLLDDNMKLKREYVEVLNVVADSEVALFFGHLTHPEIMEVAEYLAGIDFKRAVIDHPFSPFVDLDTEMMKNLTGIGVFLNFTYDELSPLLGVDPARMYEAIREVGVDYVTLSSDAGEPLFPNSAECMRLISSYMAAFGLSKEEINTVCCRNPAFIVGQSESRV